MFNTEPRLNRVIKKSYRIMSITVLKNILRIYLFLGSCELNTHTVAGPFFFIFPFSYLYFNCLNH